MLIPILRVFFLASTNIERYLLFRLLPAIGLLLLLQFPIAAQPSLIKGIELPGLYGKADTAYIRNLIRIGQNAETTSLDTSEFYFKKALQLCRQQNDHKLTAFTLAKLGYLYRLKGDNEQSLTFLKQAIEVGKRNKGDSSLPNLYNNLAATYRAKGLYSMAMINNYESLKMIRQEPKMRKSRFGAETYLGITANWFGMLEPELGLAYLDTAEQIAQELKNPGLLLTIKTMRLPAYYHANRTAEAHKLTLEALKSARLIRDKEEEVNLLTMLGAIATQEDKMTEAFDYLNKMLKLRKGMPMIHVQLLPDIFVANAYYKNKEYDKAERIIKTVIDRAKAIQDRYALWQGYGILNNIYADRKQFELAHKQLAAYVNLMDSMQRIEKDKSVEFLLQYQSIEKDKNIAQKQLHITQQEKKLQQKNFWIGGISISALLLAALSLVLYRNYHHKQQLQDATILNLQQQQKIDQLQAVMKGEENERNRIARELHDGIGSQIAAARMHLDIFTEADALPPYAHSYKSAMVLLDEAYLGLRYTAHNLLPGQLLEKGIVAAVQEYCGKISRPGLFQIHFQTFGALPELATNKALSIYRVIQELIHNSAKHSGATEVIVELGAEETRLAVSVEDNGMGWKIAEEIPDGIGMSNLKQRVSLLEGTMEIDSRQNIGTTIYLSFPLDKITKDHKS